MKKLSLFFFDLHSQFKLLPINNRYNLFFITTSFFFVLASYPLMRSSFEVIFLDHFGAKNSPLVWFLSIIVLVFSIFVYNQFQKSAGVKVLFIATGLCSILLFLILLVLFHFSSRYFIFPLYILKEVYIVLMVHMAIGFLNSILDVKKAKLFYGPIGGIGSLGGLLGGWLTQKMALVLHPEYIAVSGVVLILFSVLIFFLIKKEKGTTLYSLHESDKTPFSAIYSVRHYVFLIGAIVVLSQFCINLIQFEFNLFLENLIPTSSLRVEFLGQVFFYIGLIGLLSQFLIVPFGFWLIKNKYIHSFFPVLYFFLNLIVVFFGMGLIFPIAVLFVLYKGIDYSVFSSAKEILYFPLDQAQRFGAKYVVDMFLYRFAKGFISLFLIFFQNIFFINVLLFLFFILWFALLFPLFHFQKKILIKK